MGASGRRQLHTVLALITVGFLASYLSRLRLAGGCLFRYHPSNPFTNLAVLILSLYLFFLVSREMEAPWMEEAPREELRDIPLLIALMFPGTGLCSLIFSKFASRWIFLAMRGWSYFLLPLLYVKFWRKEPLSLLGLRGRSMLLPDFLYAFSTAVIGTAAIDSINSLVALPTEPPIHLTSFLFLAMGSSVEMIKSLAWSGLIQVRVEAPYNWSSKGFWTFFTLMSLLLNFYFEPESSLVDFLRYAPGKTLSLLISCYLFHKTKRIATSALWNWFSNIFSLIPISPS